ncbi:MAG: PTS IIA-like nitrogen regulatory protein PtsN [Alphaproteobacteria bacterium]|nr:PTS IIA-like nitrogen regulatory protein PtsN [Alphaproteobacteria bacterium]MCZ6763930.1 PTS IIA-like nitrogen regulatory protein PtsN [Alphaproteobacteria bacterium]
MEISDLLSSNAVLANLKATSKKQALQELAKVAAEISDSDRQNIFDLLLERERLGSTGVGHGVAIPHARLSGLERHYAVFARLSDGVDFDAVDDGKVDLIFLLLAPEDAGADHLKALALISRRMRDQEFCNKLRGSESGDAVYALLTAVTASHAA